MDTLRTNLAREAMRVEEDCLFSAKGHFEASSQWKRIHLWIGIPATILAAVAGASLIIDHVNFGAILAVAVAILSGLATFLNPSEKAAAHHSSGTSFNKLKNQARVFREIDLPGPDTTENLSFRLKSICADRDNLNAVSLQIPRQAFERARRGIESGEAEYRVDVT